jgi:hypothetical protein
VEDGRRRILELVREGRMSPEEAGRRLEDMVPPTLAADHETRSEPGRVRRVRINGSFGSVNVIADPAVRDAVARGPHTAHVDGDTMVIESEPRGRSMGGFSFAAVAVVMSFGSDDQLVVRMNPSLPLEVDVNAGSVRIHDVSAPIRAQVEAGSVRLANFRGPLDVRVKAGSLKGDGILAAGDSRVSCEAGSVGLLLRDGSSVRVRAVAALGKVVLGGRESSSLGGAQEMTVGDGAASLVVDADMGTVRVAIE